MDNNNNNNNRMAKRKCCNREGCPAYQARKKMQANNAGGGSEIGSESSERPPYGEEYHPNYQQQQQQPQQQPQPQYNNQQTQAPMSTAEKSAQILFVEPNFKDTPSEYDVFYDCSSVHSVDEPSEGSSLAPYNANSSRAICHILKKLENPQQFRVALKEMATTAKKLLHDFEDACDEKNAANPKICGSKQKGPNPTGGSKTVQLEINARVALNSNVPQGVHIEPVSFTIPLEIQVPNPNVQSTTEFYSLQSAAAFMSACGAPNMLEPIRTSIISSCRCRNGNAAAGRELMPPPPPSTPMEYGTGERKPSLKASQKCFSECGCLVREKQVDFKSQSLNHIPGCWANNAASSSFPSDNAKSDIGVEQKLSKEQDDEGCSCMNTESLEHELSQEHDDEGYSGMGMPMHANQEPNEYSAQDKSSEEPCVLCTCTSENTLRNFPEPSGWLQPTPVEEPSEDLPSLNHVEPAASESSKCDSDCQCTEELSDPIQPDLPTGSAPPRVPPPGPADFKCTCSILPDVCKIGILSSIPKSEPIVENCTCEIPPTYMKRASSIYRITSPDSPPPLPKKYRLVLPQHKDLNLCVPCRYTPSPLVDEHGKIICPFNCGCCLCPWRVMRTPPGIETHLLHEKIKICRCRNSGTIFTDFQQPYENAKCSNQSFYDFCPCREKAEAKFLEMFGHEMWVTSKRLHNKHVGREVLLSEVVAIPPKTTQFVAYNDVMIQDDDDEEDDEE